MDLIFILMPLWVLIEAILFLLKTGSAKTEYDINAQLLHDSDNDGAESHNSSELSIFDYDYEHHYYEDDSGVVVGISKPAKKIDKKRRQLLLAKRLARRDKDRQIVLAYFRNKKSDTKSESEDGYDSDYETSQAELVELLVKMAEYIRWHKFVSLHDLSYNFQLTNQKTNECLGKLQIIGLLQGVCDDRGKFIYVPKSEQTAVSKFIEEQNFYDWPQIGLI